MAIFWGRSRFPDHLVGTADADQLYGYGMREGPWSDTGGDTLEGRDGNDFLYGGLGRDTLLGGNHDDTLEGGLGGDLLDGGDGIDTVTHWFATSAVYINLLEGAGYAGEAEGDTFISIENVTGSSHDDVIVGDNHGNIIKGWIGHDTLLGLGGTDQLWGGDGVDLLYGGSGGDWLYGGDGDDRLWGEAGADTLSGGGGADRYIYRSVSDSPAPMRMPGTADHIHFGEGDVIDLSAIDANTAAAAGNQAFTWIEGPFTGAGQLRMEPSGKSWRVVGETTGDGHADFMIIVSGFFDASGFIL